MTNQIIGYPDPSRTVSTELFADLTSKTVVSIEGPVGEPWDGQNNMVVTFSAELTNLEYVTCRRRMTCSPEREALELQAQNAIASHNNFLAITGNPTNAQMIAEVRLLARVDKGLIKTEIPDLALLDPTPNA